MKKGFTLVEFLCVLGVIAVLSTISVPVLKRADENSRNKADDAMILVYSRAIESYRLNDYGILARIPNKRVTFEENGRVKINSELDMSSDDIAALSNSGKGVYPRTKEECLAVIKLYTGNSGAVRAPLKGSSYDFYYNRITGEISVLRENDIPIGLRDRYITLSGG